MPNFWIQEIRAYRDLHKQSPTDHFILTYGSINSGQVTNIWNFSWTILAFSNIDLELHQSGKRDSVFSVTRFLMTFTIWVLTNHLQQLKISAVKLSSVLFLTSASLLYLGFSFSLFHFIWIIWCCGWWMDLGPCQFGGSLQVRLMGPFHSYYTTSSNSLCCLLSLVWRTPALLPTGLLNGHGRLERKGATLAILLTASAVSILLPIYHTTSDLIWFNRILRN